MAEVVVMVTVDWEGDTLTTGDLAAMEVLNKQLTSLQQAIPVTHFICPAYFTRIDPENTVQRKELARIILESGAIKADDEIGSHVHCWKSLALEAGIAEEDFQAQPTGLVPAPAAPNMVRGEKSIPDEGYAVPFGVYAQPNVVLFLEKTSALLAEYLGVREVTSFRSGMWVTCNVVFESLAKAGIGIDASGVPFNYIKTAVKAVFGLDNMDHWNIALWGDQQTDDPVFTRNSLSFAAYGNGILGVLDQQISPPAVINGIMELPDTSMLIPWSNQALMCGHIDQAFELAKSSPKDIYITIGFHQERAGNPAFFKIEHYPLGAEEKQARAQAIFGAVAHAIGRSLQSTIKVNFLTVTAAARRVKG